MSRHGLRASAAIAALALCASLAAHASSSCPDQQAEPQLPKDPAMCQRLAAAVQDPGGMPLNEYEKKLGQFLGAFCHRDEAAGWKVDKRVRDTGPWVGTYADGKWTGKYFGTHQPVLVWYSPKFYQWLKINRPLTGPAPAKPQPIPEGAMIVKEMYTAPAAACAGVDPYKLRPTSGAAVMVRATQAAYDGWFWGWYGWSDVWSVDWPAKSNSPLPNMGFGQYCVNCHASAKDSQTFSALNNLKGEPGHPLIFLSQNFFLNPSWPSSGPPAEPPAMQAPAMPQQRQSSDGVHVRLILQALRALRAPKAKPETQSKPTPFMQRFGTIVGMPLPDEVKNMPPATYDNVWVKQGTLTAHSQFVTSDQCLGCHDAGGTGFQFDMTEPGTNTLLRNISPYATWRYSPMGLAGRDPIFFAQLASETDAFHPEFSNGIQDTCFGCHGVLGQRQFGIDRPRQSDGQCAPFLRDTVDAVPYPPRSAMAKLAQYGALARDGVSCAACHHMVLGEKDSAPVSSAPQNQCVKQRQAALNPGLSKLAATFTGSFFVGPPDKLYGPFADPKTQSMKHALGIEPAHNANIKSSEVCGSCHSVHLPIYYHDKTIGHIYEQTTYPEWAFSAYRTGATPDGDLPLGSGPLAQSCQACHMPNKDAEGNPYRSKIAEIQERSNFPEAENALPAKDIDLPVRAGFAKHTLVGLNLILLKMAAQFPENLGIRVQDPMLGSNGINSIPTTEAAMVDQALNRTADVIIGDVKNDGYTLSARVTVNSKVGHKFPSGVGFRRAFIEFDVLDAADNTLWSSGATDEFGVIVGGNGKPVAGEMWWNSDCSARIEPDARLHQPHYQKITRQDEAQIYQELVSTPPERKTPVCGPNAQPEGQLTTSFLSICAKVKDNRLLPHGFLGLEDRKKIALALGAKPDLAEDTSPVGVGADPDYVYGGGDSLTYSVSLQDLKGHAKPAAVRATLYYQPTPPFFLQDRFCTSHSRDTRRLYDLAGNLDLKGSLAEKWKVRVVTSGPVAVPPTP